jgi:hypothetical protein
MRVALHDINNNGGGRAGHRRLSARSSTSM